MLRFSFLAFILLGATSANAQVYKCVDAAGKTVYSQDPCPPKTKSEAISHDLAPAPAPAAPAAGADASGKAAGPKLTPEQAFDKRQKEKAEADKKEQEKLAKSKEKDENCRRAREQLTQLQIGGRVARYNSNGERYFLDDDQINQEKVRTQSTVNQWCN
jgi:Domain of unknown function (DUF4124)